MAIQSLFRMCENSFLICRVKSDTDENFIRAQFQNCDEIPRHRILFHETIEGKVAFVREVKSSLHIDGKY